MSHDNTIGYARGNAADTSLAYKERPLVVAHVCNNIGAWGAGFTRSINDDIGPRPEMMYRVWAERCLRSGSDTTHTSGEFTPLTFGLGQVQIVRVNAVVFVANMVAQNGLRSATNPVPLQYAELETCLWVLGFLTGLLAGEDGVTVQMPRIGCGLAGGEWARVEPLILKHLCHDDVNRDVRVLDFP